MAELSPLFGWRGSLVGDEGPGNYVYTDEGGTERKVKATTIRAVGLALSLHMNERGSSAFPSTKTLASEIALSARSVQKALDALVALGWLRETKREDDRRRQTTTLYEAMVPTSQPGEKPGENEGEGEPASPPGANGVRGEGERGSPLEGVTEDDQRKYPGREIAAAWGKLAPPLIRHPAPYFKSKRFETAVRSALQTYELDAILKAIENYAAVLASPAHYWTHRYSAVDFLRRERATPGVEKFVDEALPLENFRTKKDTDRDGAQQRTPAEQLTQAEQWILATAWRLPMEEWEVAEELGKRGVEGPDRKRLLELWQTKRQAAA